MLPKQAYEKLAITLSLLISFAALNVQKYKINIRAGGNTSIISKFENSNTCVEDFLIPNYYDIISGSRFFWRI